MIRMGSAIYWKHKIHKSEATKLDLNQQKEEKLKRDIFTFDNLSKLSELLNP